MYPLAHGTAARVRPEQVLEWNGMRIEELLEPRRNCNFGGLKRHARSSHEAAQMEKVPAVVLGEEIF
jgi:hypothetical protein